MFWIWFEWQVFTTPHNFEEDWDTIKLNKVSEYYWKNMPMKCRGMAIAIEFALEN